MKKFIKTSKKFGTVEVLVDDEDVHLLENNSWTVAASPHDNTIYVHFSNTRKNKKFKSELLHRIIMDVPPHLCVDHINHNGLDNRRFNLRICTDKENKRNVYARKDKKHSKYKGVGKKRGKWTARIGGYPNRKFLGSFDSEIQAALAYNKAAIELFGEFALLNIIKENASG